MKSSLPRITPNDLIGRLHAPRWGMRPRPSMFFRRPGVLRYETLPLEFIDTFIIGPKHQATSTWYATKGIGALPPEHQAPRSPWLFKKAPARTAHSLLEESLRLEARYLPVAIIARAAGRALEALTSHTKDPANIHLAGLAAWHFGALQTARTLLEKADDMLQRSILAAQHPRQLHMRSQYLFMRMEIQTHLGNLSLDARAGNDPLEHFTRAFNLAKACFPSRVDHTDSNPAGERILHIRKLLKQHRVQTAGLPQFWAAWHASVPLYRQREDARSNLVHFIHGAQTVCSHVDGKFENCSDTEDAPSSRSGIRRVGDTGRFVITGAVTQVLRTLPAGTGTRIPTNPHLPRARLTLIQGGRSRPNKG